MTTNINFYGKPFGAPLLPNKMTSDGWSIIDARHIGGHRVVDTVDDLYELYDWQLINPSALLNEDTNSAVGQKWYVKGEGTYMLKNYNNRHSSSGWVKIEDTDGYTILPDLGKPVVTLIRQNTNEITGIKNKLTTGANKPNGAIVLDANGYIPSTADTAFRKINGKSILKTSEDTSDITIDLSLFVIPADNQLPTTGIDPNKIYLIRQTAGSAASPGQDDSNIYIEYLYVNNAWEKIGEYKASIDHTAYLKKTEAETMYVKQSFGSPANYILCTATYDNIINSTYNNGNNEAVSVSSLKNVFTKVIDTMLEYSPMNHTHIVTINGTDKTIGPNKVDLGTYLVESEFNVKAQAFTYGKVEIDNKIKNVTTSSLGISTLTNTEIDTMFTQIFG